LVGSLKRGKRIGNPLENHIRAWGVNFTRFLARQGHKSFRAWGYKRREGGEQKLAEKGSETLAWAELAARASKRPLFQTGGGEK